MEAETASEFPDSLDGVEFGTVGRKEIKGEGGGLLYSPGQVEARSVVLGIITDHNDAAAIGGAGLAQQLQKLPKAFAVESAGFATIKEFSIAQSYGAEVSHAAASRVMVKDWIPDFGRDPHATARAVLLEMHFVQRPQIDASVSH